MRNTLDTQDIERARIDAEYAKFKVELAPVQAMHDSVRLGLIEDGLDILPQRDLAWEKAQARAARRAAPSWGLMKRQFVDAVARRRMEKALGLRTYSEE
jgi:hypothetical protein